MPVKKIFAIAISTSKKRIKIPVCQVSFPNGCVLFKLYKKPDPIWLINVNGNWKATAPDKPDDKMVVAIINILRHITLKGHLYKV